MNLFEGFFQATAWAMKQPRPYHAFHLLLAAAGISLSFTAARRLSTFRKRDTLLLACGILLALSELYKQGFLYYIVNGRQYDWWYFPFQLCSVPMYLALLLPLAGAKLKQCLCTFIQDYGLLGGFMALAEPSGLMHPYWVLTLHGFLWHFMLLFMGFLCALSDKNGKKWKDYLSTLPLFSACCIIATAVNVLSHPLGNADMFYISPYYPNGQIVFHEISLAAGTLTGNLLYLLSVLTGGFLCHLLAGKMYKMHTQHTKGDIYHVGKQRKHKS